MTPRSLPRAGSGAETRAECAVAGAHRKQRQPIVASRRVVHAAQQCQTLSFAGLGVLRVQPLLHRAAEAEPARQHEATLTPGERPRNCAQILDPMINEGQRKILLVTIARGKEDRIDSRHLPVVRSRADADVKGFSETRKGKQTDEPDDEGPKLSGDEGADTYENHNNYGFYKQRQCQS